MIQISILNSKSEKSDLLLLLIIKVLLMRLWAEKKTKSKLHGKLNCRESETPANFPHDFYIILNLVSDCQIIFTMHEM